MQDLLALVDARPGGRSQHGSAEHSGDVRLVRGPGANEAAGGRMDQLQVDDLRANECAVHPLAKGDDGGAGSCEVADIGQRCHVEVETVVAIPKKVPVADRRWIHAAGTERIVKRPASKASIGQIDAEQARPPRAALADKDEGRYGR
jgi:hypothetical protein